MPGTVLGAGIPIGKKGNEVSILKDLSGEDGPNTRKQTHKINPNCGKSYERNKHMVEIENQQQCLLQIKWSEKEIVFKTRHKA